MKISLLWAISIIGILSFFVIGASVSRVEDAVIVLDDTPSYQPCYSSPEIVLEYFPNSQSVYLPMIQNKHPVPAPLFPSKKDLMVIGKLSDGIYRIKSRQGGWWECGIFYKDPEDIKNKAVEYAYVIVREAWEVSEPLENENPWVLNPWGLAGTILNESGFDRCAFGIGPRNMAYELGLLKRKKTTISHTEEEIIAVVSNEKMQNLFNRSGFDLGVAQVLSRFYPNPTNYKNMLSIKGGTAEAARQMLDRGRSYRTDRPWKYWPGTIADWYDEKVTRWGRMLGATARDI